MYGRCIKTYCLFIHMLRAIKHLLLWHYQNFQVQKLLYHCRESVCLSVLSALGKQNFLLYMYNKLEIGLLTRLPIKIYDLNCFLVVVKDYIACLRYNLLCLSQIQIIYFILLCFSSRGCYHPLLKAIIKLGSSRPFISNISPFDLKLGKMISEIFL